VIKRQEPPSDDGYVLSGDSELLSDALVADLNIFYAFDMPGQFLYVREHDRKVLGLDHSDLRKLSVSNLVKLRSRPEILRPSDAAVMLRETLQHAVNRIWGKPNPNRKMLLTRSLLIRRDTRWEVFEP
jgi:hypothetical protein